MANRFFVNGGVNNNWGTTGNWSTTSGGAGGSSVPSSTDDVFLDGNSPNCTVNTSTRSCKSLTCTGYTNTLTLAAQLDIFGNCTLVSGMTFTHGSQLVRIRGTCTLTSAGKTFFGLTILSATTLADNLDVDGTLTTSAALSLVTFQLNL